MYSVEIPAALLPDRKRTLPDYDVMRLLRPFLESLKAGDRVLDLGAGSGLQAREAVRHGAHVVAVDIMDRPSDLESEQVEWLKSGLEEYIASLSPGVQFDGALLQNIVHFFPKEYVIKVLLPSIISHTKPGALVAVETMSAPPTPTLKKFQSYYSPDELLSVLNGEVILAEQSNTQRQEDDGTFRTFHHTRIIVRRGDAYNEL